MEKNAEQLIDFLNYALETAAELHEILKDSQQSLVPLDTTRLDALNLRQESLTNELNTQQQTITQWFGQHNLAPTSRSLQQLMQALPKEEANTLNHVWKKWKNLMQSCQNQWLINSPITAASQQAVSRSLTILKDQASPPNFYDASGKLIDS